MSDNIRAHLGLLIASIVTFIIMGAGLAIFGPALPAYTRLLGLELDQVSWLISAHWIGCAIGVGGLYFLGKTIPLLYVLAIIAGGTGLLALNMGIVISFAGAAIFGAGYGMASAVLNPRLLIAFGPRGPAMLSLTNACFGIGAIVAPLAYIWLGSQPSLTFSILAALTLLNMLLAWRSDKPAPPSQAAVPALSTGFRPRFRLQAFAVLAIGLEASMGGLGPSALIAAGQSETMAAQLLSGFFLAFLAARIGLIFIAHRVAPFSIYSLSIAACLIFSLLAATISPTVFFVALGMPAGLFFPSFYVTASRAMGQNARTAPIIIGAGLIGGILAPILIAPLMPDLGSRGYFFVLAALAGLGLIAAIITRSRLPELRQI